MLCTFQTGTKGRLFAKMKMFFQRANKTGELLSSDNDMLQLLRQLVSRFSRNLRLNTTYIAVPTDKHKSEPDFLPFVQYLVFLLDIQQACDTTKVSYCDGLLDVIFAIHVWTHHKLCCLGQENEVSDSFVLG